MQPDKQNTIENKIIVPAIFFFAKLLERQRRTEIRKSFFLVSYIVLVPSYSLLNWYTEVIQFSTNTYYMSSVQTHVSG